MNILLLISLMGIVLLFFTSYKQVLFWNLICFEFWSHFLIDVLKGRLNGWFPSLQSPANKIHWIVFGADQFAHALVIIIIYNFTL